MSKEDAQPSDRFVQLLTEHQVQLRGFILASLGDDADSHDVLQSTNLALWRKAAEFRPDAELLPWALGVARFEILAFLRDRSRDRLVFRAELVEAMADTASELVAKMPARRLALRECLKEVPEKNRILLRLRYAHNQSITQISAFSGRSMDGVKSLLLRIRKALARCIELRLAEE